MIIIVKHYPNISIIFIQSKRSRDFGAMADEPSLESFLKMQI